MGSAPAPKNGVTKTVKTGGTSQHALKYRVPKPGKKRYEDCANMIRLLETSVDEPRKKLGILRLPHEGANTPRSQ